MSYQFDFLWLGEYWPQIAKGIAITSQLTLVGGVIGVSLGTACACVALAASASCPRLAP